MSVLPVQAVYRLTENDAHEAHREHWGGERRVQQLVAAAAVIVSAIAWVKQQQPLALLSFVLATCVIFWMWFAGRRDVEKRPTRPGETFFVATEEGVSFAAHAAACDVQWRSVQYIKETENLYLFYLQPRLFHIVPKRAFNVQDLTELRMLLERNLGERSRWIAGASQMKLAVVVLAVAVALVLVFFVIHARR